MAPPSPAPLNPPIPDDEHAPSLPLPMSASVVLSALPIDAATALAEVDDMQGKKGNFSIHKSGVLRYLTCFCIISWSLYGSPMRVSANPKSYSDNSKKSKSGFNLCLPLQLFRSECSRSVLLIVSRRLLLFYERSWE